MFRFVTLSSVAIFIAHLHLSEGYDVVPVEADGGVALEQYQCLYQSKWSGKLQDCLLLFSISCLTKLNLL